MPSLAQKQQSTQEDWLLKQSSIEQDVSREMLDRRVESTLDEIARVTRGKQVAFAWSGGKDSLVLESILYQAHIHECVLVLCDLEYPTFLQWVTDHMPHALEIVHTGQDLSWLQKNQHMLFPQNADMAAKWFKAVQHTGQDLYYKKYHLDILILGRRKMDGNYVGRGENIYTNARHITRYSPLSDWSHEEVLAYIHYYQIQLPPCYSWLKGFRVGTGPWAARQWTESIQSGWQEVYDIDRSIVEEASGYIPSAEVFLERRG